MESKKLLRKIVVDINDKFMEEESKYSACHDDVQDADILKAKALVNELFAVAFRFMLEVDELTEKVNTLTKTVERLEKRKGE